MATETVAQALSRAGAARDRRGFRPLQPCPGLAMRRSTRRYRLARTARRWSPATPEAVRAADVDVVVALGCYPSCATTSHACWRRIRCSSTRPPWPHSEQLAWRAPPPRSTQLVPAGSDRRPTGASPLRHARWLSMAAAIAPCHSMLSQAAAAWPRRASAGTSSAPGRARRPPSKRIASRWLPVAQAAAP